MLALGCNAYNAGTMGQEVGSEFYYRWEVPGKAIVVNLNLGVVDRLGLAIRQEGDAPHRRAEIGGFLLGSVKRNRGVPTVAVEDFEPVACEHAFGPSYFLSGDDQRAFAERLRRHKRKGRLSIVGFFRTNTRKEFALTVEDIGLMERHFSKPSMVLLMVHAALGEALRAGFSIWEQRAIQTAKPYGEFRFEASALRDGSSVISRRTPERARGAPFRAWLRAALPGNPGAVRTRARATPSRVLTPLRGQFGIKWIIATAVLASAMLAGALYRGARPPEVTVTVRPPEQKVEQKVSPFENAVHRGPEAVVASAAVVAPPPVSPLPTDAAPLPASSPSPPAGNTTHEPQTAWRASPVHIAPRAASIPSLPPAPEVAAMLPPSPALPEVASETLPPLTPAVPPFVTFAVEALPYGHKGLRSRFASHKGEPKGTTYVPPRLVEQRSVEVPPEVRSRIQNNTVPITVKLYVGREGKVEYAELLSDGTGANRDIASLAVFASRKFQFSPAQEGKQTVPAEVLVRFRFGATANQ